MAKKAPKKLDLQPKGVVLAHVVDLTGVPRDEAEALTSEAGKRMETIKKRVFRAGMTVDHYVGFATDPEQLMLELADREKATMIALGSRGRSFMTETILGSV